MPSPTPEVMYRPPSPARRRAPRPAWTPITRALAGMLLCSAVLAPAHADEQGDRIRALETRLAALEKLLAQQNTAASKPAAAPAPSAAATAAAAAAQSQALGALQAQVNQMAESLGRSSVDTGLPVHGFADVGAAWSSGEDPSRLRGFNGGTLDLYLTPQFGQRVKSLIEIAIEYGSDGGIAIDMERLQLGYTVSDALTVWAGRFHTPFGLWNTSFHHGANLQTSVFRPRFIDFEDKGGIVPAHTVGLWASGKLNLGLGRMTADAFVGNGPSIHDRTLDFNGFTDNSANKLFGFNIGLRPRGALSGLTLGVHGMGAQVESQDGARQAFATTRLRMLGGYASWDADDWELLAEAYRFSNTDAASGSGHRSTAWFAQLGRTVGDWTPFVRLESAALDAGDAYFASQESGRPYRRVSAGARYALDAKASLKLELSDTREDAVTLLDDSGGALPVAAARYRRLALQYSVAF